MVTSSGEIRPACQGRTMAGEPSNCPLTKRHKTNLLSEIRSYISGSVQSGHQRIGPCQFSSPGKVARRRGRPGPAINGDSPMAPTRPFWKGYFKLSLARARSTFTPRRHRPSPCRSGRSTLKWRRKSTPAADINKCDLANSNGSDANSSIVVRAWSREVTSRSCGRNTGLQIWRLRRWQALGLNQHRDSGRTAKVFVYYRPEKVKSMPAHYVPGAWHVRSMAYSLRN